jgi:hypothetical protein
VKNSREKMFAIIVGGLAVMVVGWFVYSWVYGQFDKRTKDIARLTSDIKKFDHQGQLGERASRKLTQYEERSLPSNPDDARTDYQEWLVNRMEEAISSQGSDRDLFIKQTFAVEASGTLPQIVELLHDFYSVDWLHRITQFKLRPVKDSKLLNLTMHIETLSMRRASHPDKLEPRKSNRLALASTEAYYDAIVGRNLFGPRNNAPTISISGSQEVFLGREAELTIKGTDPDPHDVVYYRLVESSYPEAKVDSLTGKFSWTPKAVGKFEFVVEGIDDGFPAKVSNREKITLTVKEQKNERQGIAFDFAKYTILTAVLDVDGQGEIWLHVRPTGQMVTLHQGDQFEIGSVKGTVAQIGEYDFAFDFEGKRRKLAKGELLEQAKIIGDVPQVAVPAKPAGAEVEVQAKPDDKAS